MRAMVFEGVGRPLRACERPVPRPGPGQLLIRVHACGVCRTDLHLLDGEVEVRSPPRILGHQIVGTVQATGAGVDGEAAVGADGGERRVGVPWLGWTDGDCAYCRSERENLCPNARFTGCDIDGGYAEYTVADARYCFAIPAGYSDEQAAPLMCAGLIGYRALRMCDPDRAGDPVGAAQVVGATGEPQRIGFYGFGDAAHILAQICRWQGREVYAFTRPGDDRGQAFARELGAVWAGSSEEPPPRPLDAAIVFAPVGALVPLALRAVAPGGTVVCGGIYMSEIPAFPYSILWQERTLRSVANLTRRDGEELLALAPRAGVETHVTTYPLDAANDALADLRAGRFTGAAVLVP
jgi:propanol-preferring alcohol dehydrogenase